mmetsp:Transcript_29320/g.73769  ORF Transcript_29320/g.73769 Transcript_29320/m.73769 type:complete len:239 (+) Transcript_29320:408-1124(+)
MRLLGFVGERLWHRHAHRKGRFQRGRDGRGGNRSGRGRGVPGGLHTAAAAAAPRRRAAVGVVAARFALLRRNDLHERAVRFHDVLHFALHGLAQDGGRLGHALPLGLLVVQGAVGLRERVALRLHDGAQRGQQGAVLPPLHEQYLAQLLDTEVLEVLHLVGDVGDRLLQDLGALLARLLGLLLQLFQVRQHLLGLAVQVHFEALGGRVVCLGALAHGLEDGRVQLARHCPVTSLDFFL